MGREKLPWVAVRSHELPGSLCVRSNAGEPSIVCYVLQVFAYPSRRRDSNPGSRTFHCVLSANP